MKLTRLLLTVLAAITFSATALLCPDDAPAHCDTLDGPVVETARTALAKGEVTPLLKWVRPADEQELKNAFRQTLEVRKLGEQARELADRYFFETLVRIHRAGEGAPYTGLKPGDSVDPAVVLADKALESGSADKLAEVLRSPDRGRDMGKRGRERVLGLFEKKKLFDCLVTHYETLMKET